MNTLGLEPMVLRVPGRLPRYILPLPYDRPPLSLNDRGRSKAAVRGKARKVRELRAAVYVVGKALKAEPWPHLRVVLHYVPADARVRDRDNLVATLKPCIDALTAKGADRGWPCLGMVPDDDPEHISWAPPVIHEPDEHGARVWLTVQALPHAPRDDDDD